MNQFHSAVVILGGGGEGREGGKEQQELKGLVGGNSFLIIQLISLKYDPSVCKRKREN